MGEASGVVVLTGEGNVTENPWQVLLLVAPGLLCGALGEIDTFRVRYNLPPKKTAKNPKATDPIPRIAVFQFFFIVLFLVNSNQVSCDEFVLAQKG